MQKISTVFYLFPLALNFFQANSKISISNAHKTNKSFDLRQGIRAALATQDLKAMSFLVENLLDKKINPSFDFVQKSLLYLKMCQFENQSVFTSTFLNDKYFDDFVSSKNIALVGASEIYDESNLVITPNILVARTVGIGTTVFPQTDIFSGKCNLAYTDRLFVEQYNNYLESIESFDFISINAKVRNLSKEKKWRLARNPHKLIFNGGANKVPFMLFDLLLSKPTSIKIYGTTFFASKIIYSDSYRSIDHSGYKILRSGNTENRKLSVVTGLASHNPFANRNFVKNLMASGVIKLDFASASIINCSDTEYASQLAMHNQPNK